MTHTDDRARPAKPLTLAIDVGGSHLKAAVLKDSGKVSTGPLRVETPKPATSEELSRRWLASHNGSASMIASRSASRA